MPSPVTLVAERLLTPRELLSPGWVTVAGSVVVGVGAGTPPAGARIVDLAGRLLVPGFIDLHVHGGGGEQVNGGRTRSVADSVRSVAAFHARHGTTALLATTASDSPDNLVSAVRGIAETMREPAVGGARILGAHLEGPWLAPARAGAHDPSQLRSPTVDELECLLAAAPGAVRMVTLAPELRGALDVIAAMRAARVVASLGHTEAHLETVLAAADAGATHVTHLFNAMSGLHHREPGLVGAALSDPRLSVEIVADGEHVHSVVLGLVLRLAAGRVVAVTDAVAATGVAAGSSRVGGLAVEVSGGGRVSLTSAPGTLAGSTLTMDRAVAGLVAAGASLVDAVSAATAAPARVVDDTRGGQIRVGGRADIAVLSADLSCAATIVGGRTVFDPEGLLPPG